MKNYMTVYYDTDEFGNTAWAYYTKYIEHMDLDNKYPYGYCSYHVQTDDENIIIYDGYCTTRVGQLLTDIYPQFLDIKLLGEMILVYIEMNSEEHLESFINSLDFEFDICDGFDDVNACGGMWAYQYIITDKTNYDNMDDKWKDSCGVCENFGWIRSYEKLSDWVHTYFEDWVYTDYFLSDFTFDKKEVANILETNLKERTTNNFNGMQYDFKSSMKELEKVGIRLLFELRSKEFYRELELRFKNNS